MITEKEYLEAKMIIKLYESQQLNISGVICSDCFPDNPVYMTSRGGNEPNHIRWIDQTNKQSDI